MVRSASGGAAAPGGSAGTGKVVAGHGWGREGSVVEFVLGRERVDPASITHVRS